MSVRIITDSTCDLPARIVSALGIGVIPLHIHVGERDYLDGIEMTRQEFYEKLPTFAEHPTTAVPSPHKFRAAYEALAAEGASEILSIHISNTLSAVVNVAQAAAAEITSVPVTVFDSRQLSLGTGFMVQTAAELAAAGSSAKEILAVLGEQVRRTHVWAALDTLHFLRRSGRMSRLVSTIGELIHLKPILKMYDGVSGVERVRTQEKALKRLATMLHTYSPFEKIAFLHSGAIERVQALQDQVRTILPHKEIWLEVINPVLGAHLGPGVVGFACVSQEK